MKNKALEDVLDWLNHEINTINKEINTRNETVESLQTLVDDLKEFDKNEDYKIKYENLLSENEKEKERLVKLHNHYKNIEIEYNNLLNKVKGWEGWFYSNKDIFDRLFSSAPPVALSESEENLTRPTSKSKKIKKKNKKK